MAQEIVTEGNYYSVAQLASFDLPGFPRSRKGWYDLVEREHWVFREVRAAGQKGLRREYLPPPDVMSLIEAAKGSRPDDWRDIAVEAMQFVQRGRITRKLPEGVLLAEFAGSHGLDEKVLSAWISEARRGEYKHIGTEPLVTGSEVRSGLEAQDVVARNEVLVPRYEVKGSGGHGTVIHEERIVEYIAFSPAFIRDVLRVPSTMLAIIEVSGHSMEPTLTSGEQVIVDLRCDRFDDDAVYVIQHNGNLRIKRVQVRLDGTVVIKSDNPSYEPEILKREEADQLHVVGTVLPYKFGRFKL